MSEPPPRVSVVIPTFDREALLAEALDSAGSQEGVSFEIVVVDDGSRDGTPRLLADRAGGDPRLRVLRQANAGPSAARNRGVAAARGEYVAFLASDDRMLPGNLASQAALLDAHPEADLVICDVRFEGNWKRRAGMTMFTRPGWKPPTSLDAVSRGAAAAPSSMMLRAEVARALPFDEGLTWFEDVDFLFRFHASGRRLLVNPGVLAAWREVAHAGQERLSRSAPDRALAARIEVMERHLPRAPDPRAARAFLDRLRAKLLVRQGRWPEARGPLFAVWRRRPWALHVLRQLLRSLVARRGAGARRGAAS